MMGIHWKESWLGQGERYNYKHLCLPTHPWTKHPPKLNFYSKDEPIPLLLSALMGLQHCFAMVGGLITPPLIVFRFVVCDTNDEYCTSLEQYAISAALITSGICTLINVAKIKIPYSEKVFGRPLYLGSGVLSVVGTSFTFLPIYQTAIDTMTTTNGMSGVEAYGAMLGTSMVCSFLELLVSLIPIKKLQKLFPPLVTSITVMLIGMSLCGTGMKYWGGGVVCAEMGWKTHVQVVDLLKEHDNNSTTIMELLPPPSAVCSTYGDDEEDSLYYGAPEYIGLGFSVLCMLVLIELFGSVFMKNTNVILALVFGYVVAAVTNYHGYPYILTENTKNAEPITFLWVYTFPISFYGPAVIPLLIAYLVTTVETVGDITATYEASQLEPDTPEYTTSIQGGLTQDWFSSILAGLFTAMPNTTFSQNNGVVSLTKCASRRAGYAAGCWLIFMGMFGKIAGWITSIPDCVMGGMTIFLFANVLASGISLTGSIDLHNSRRNKFILAMSMAIGCGVTVWPFAFQDRRASPYTAWFWTCADCSETMQGLRDGVSIFLSTGYCVGTVVAMLLNIILPNDPGISYYAKDFEKHEDDEDEDDEEEKNNGNNVIVGLDYPMSEPTKQSEISSDKAITMTLEEEISAETKTDEKEVEN